jgi:hypothetical protein
VHLVGEMFGARLASRISFSSVLEPHVPYCHLSLLVLSNGFYFRGIYFALNFTIIIYNCSFIFIISILVDCICVSF